MYVVYIDMYYNVYLYKYILFCFILYRYSDIYIEYRYGHMGNTNSVKFLAIGN